MLTLLAVGDGVKSKQPHNWSGRRKALTSEREWGECLGLPHLSKMSHDLGMED